ncbi:MAG: AmmeMemoRadiSam system radical SAM enzyme [Candidatus Bathyarchaeota archaeon]|nr:MAG: AmmeMemoRadiSam system radical SAM enzyme [Candidatus Bathyarchaeota archaeon]
MNEAMYYSRLDEKTVQCQLCFRRCTIRTGSRGFCKNRLNAGGTLYTLVYGKPCAMQIDPVEKEPLFHVMPGSRIFCIGTSGCNFRCSFCQNWHMSYKRPEEVTYYTQTPEDLVQMAIQINCTGFHFTYNEPTVFYEFMLDVAKEAQERGLTTAFHSNGAMNPEPLRELLEHMDAVTIDLKSFDQGFYDYVTEQAVSGPFTPSSPALESVLSTLQTIKEEGVWLEIVNLVIPTLNDDMEGVRDMCIWIRDNLGDDVPLHFIRFMPACKLTKLPPTPVETLEEARRTAASVGLKYVYVGNVPGHEGNSSFCPLCDRPLIVRYHFSVLEYNLMEGRCKFCGHEIPGIWSNQ